MRRKAWAADAFRDHERHVWGLAYRITGSAADADDVVQETFARTLERAPRHVDRPLRPWLTQVALNLARDALRRRKRRPYIGPWLPSPVETSRLDEPAPQPRSGADGVDARYELRESASYAFLVALEALTPQQRVVLVLRDVLDYSVRETADALDISEANVKTTHHRARSAMVEYDSARQPPTAVLAQATRAMLERFLFALVNGDVRTLMACLADDARSVADGGGEFLAALRPILGRDRVARFLLGLQKKARWRGRFDLRSVNALPALVAEFDAAPSRWAPRIVFRIELGSDGRIRDLFIVAASSKLSAV
jgi:RNA polymerase sigma-70 factor (ECF subfamily)